MDNSKPEVTPSLDVLLTSLRSNRRLEREKGISELQKLIDKDVLQSGDLDKLKESMLEVLNNPLTTWEEKHGAIMATCLLVKRKSIDDVFVNAIKRLIPELLEHVESRIRIETGELIGLLCCHYGVIIYDELEECIVKGISDTIDRDITSADPDLMMKLGRGDNEEKEKEERPSSPTAAQIFHDTAGWKTLETYMNALHHAVDGCGNSFEPHITSDLLDILFTALKHTNRFVREMGYKVMSSIVKCPGLSQETINKYWMLVTQQLAEGLADNWSQVRMSASIATREFLNHVSKENRKQYLPVLLPPMCLNRYYVAEGVRLYSQETWRQVTEGRGIQLVEEYIQNVVSFYIVESQASNHAVREAACACIAELGTKVSPDRLRTHIGSLVGALLDCFKDDSWPVRDAACLACGNFISCFPEESRTFMDELFPLFLKNLEDSIPSVRQGGAVAIASIVKAYGTDMEVKVVDVIKERLPLVKEQPANVDDNAPRHPDVDSRPAIFGVVRSLRDNDYEVHSNQQMYSCGSLAPKMKRGGSGGCMDHQFHKPSQPWEKSEGCVYLLAELSQLKQCHDNVLLLLPVLADTTRHKHYIQHYNYFESIMKQLPVIAKSIGKRQFKQYLEIFIDVIFYGLSSDSPQLKIASSDCLHQLTNLIGRMIMRGRIEQHNPNYLSHMDGNSV